MQTEFTEDQQHFREVVSKFMEAKSTPVDVRRLMETEQGFDEGVWKQLSEEVGLAGTHIPEAYGGFGFGPVELGIVAEEMGRHLYCGPFFSSSVMAGSALLYGGTESAKQRLLPDIASGAVIGTLVLDSLDAPDKLGHALTVDASGNLNGTARIVVDAVNASLLVIVASTEDGLGLFATSPTAAGIVIEAHESLDATRKIASVSFSSTPVESIGQLASENVDQIWNAISIALSHEMIGGAQRLFDTTVDYTKVRVQFGRPIGSFQALKHRCADLLMTLEFTRAAVHHAAFVQADKTDNYSASSAKAMASDTYMEAARAAVQLRGGIGFTWEEDTHLWFKRAKSAEVMMGSAQMHRERMMASIDRLERIESQAIAGEASA